MRTTPGSHRQLEIPTGIKWVSLFNPYIARIVDNGLVVFYTLSASTPSQDKNPSLSGHSDDALTRFALTNNPIHRLLCFANTVQFLLCTIQTILHTVLYFIWFTVLTGDIQPYLHHPNVYILGSIVIFNISVSLFVLVPPLVAHWLCS